MVAINKQKRWVLIGIVVLAGWLALRYLRQPDALPVPVAVVDQGVVETTAANTRAGTVKACRRSELSMALGGLVQKLNVKKGDKITAGEVLVELWNEDRKASVTQAEASLSAAMHQQKQACINANQNARDSQRAKSLYEKRLISSAQTEAASTLSRTAQQACDAAEDQVKMNQANLDLAQSHYDLTFLRAPYDGVVVEVNSELGEYVTPSPSGVLTKPVIEMLDNTCLYVTAPIDEVDAKPLRVGQRVRITLDAFRGQEFDGHLTRVAPYVVEVEKQARTVDVDVRFDNIPQDVALLIGYSADVEIVLDTRNQVLRIPTEAIIDKKSAYVLQDGKLHKRDIVTGLSNWTMTEVVSGLQAGDKVVLAPDRAGIKEGAAAREETADDRKAAAAAKKSP
ncbi:MAG TPA: efflux RND transporter periplasmic adaptor subunit [Pseudomonadales bacterium]|jgi:HlyD family secretion protein|nr:efflux RND transporter periplasmic adaptor subunit [Pseudomonadales bacterium]